MSKKHKPRYSYDLEDTGKKQSFDLYRVERYKDTEALHIIVVFYDEDGDESYLDFTVNIGPSGICKRKEGYVNTYELPNAKKFIREYELAEREGGKLDPCSSGSDDLYPDHKFPLYRFKFSTIPKLK